MYVQKNLECVAALSLYSPSFRAPPRDMDGRRAIVRMPDDIAAGSSPASATPEVAGAVETPASATPTPAQSTAAGEATPEGPIPFQRHKAILDAAYLERDEARKALAEHAERTGWAEQVDPSEFQQLQRWSAAYREDPVRWMASTIGELRQQFPHLTPALTSEAARILGAARGLTAEPEPDIEPDIPVLDAQGQVVSQAFSADRVKQLVARAVKEAVNPLKERVDHREASETARQERAAAIEEADTLFKRGEQWHGFAEHKPAIAKAFSSHPTWSLQDAYLHVLHTDILPKLDHKSQGKLLTQLQTQAAGATVRPDGGGQGKPDFKGDFRKALDYYSTHPDEAAAMEQR